MTDFKSFVEEVRAHADIVEVIGADVELRPAGNSLKGLSLFHEEKTPSFVVWPADQRWKDYSNGGDLGGDVFSYVQQRDKVGFKEAVFTLAERYGVRKPDQDEVTWKREVDAMAERREMERLLTAAADYYHKALPTEIRERIFRAHYGFTDETIDEQQLGWADGTLFEHFIRGLGTSRVQALKTGLFVVLPGGQVVDLFCKRLVIPYWRSGQAVYFIARATEHTGDEPWEKAKYKKLITHSTKYDYVSPTIANDYFYNEDAARSAEELLITEGVTDCIAAHQAGVACISPATTRFRTEDVPKLQRITHHAKRIIICNDAEVSGAGEEGARATAATLWAAGRDVRVALIPRPEGTNKIDVNELVATAGPEALRAVLATARSYPHHLLDSIPAETPAGELERLLEPVLAAAASRSPIVAEAIVGAVTDKFGIGKRAVMQQVKELAAKARVDSPVQVDGAGALPEIEATNRQLSDLVVDATQVVSEANQRRLKEAALGQSAKDNAPLFQREGRLVMLQRVQGGLPALALIEQTDLFGILAREANWFRETAAARVSVFPPKDVVRDLMAFLPSSIPAVEMVITTPVFGRDGNLIVEPGLHPDDRLWLEVDPALRVGDIPASPSATEVAAALGLFKNDLLVDFPFATEADFAHALAAILQTFVRPLIDGCTPLHLIDSPQPGSGKTLLAKVTTITATGREGEARTLAESEDEIRKALTAELILARPVVLFDNAREGRVIRSSALASVLTTRRWTDRYLGKSKAITLPVNALWLLTGNNVRCSKEITRRSVHVRITPNVDQAWLRDKFKHTPITGWAQAHRSALVRAALILIQAWIADGRPAGVASLGSYEQWAHTMGGILAVAGVPGFLGNLQDLYAEADDDDADWREFVAAWWDQHHDAEVLIVDLVALCVQQDLLLPIRGDGTARSQQTRLGQALRGIRDRVFGGCQVRVRHSAHDNRTVCALERVRPAATPERNPDTAGEDPDEVGF